MFPSGILNTFDSKARLRKIIEKLTEPVYIMNLKKKQENLQ